MREIWDIMRLYDKLFKLYSRLPAACTDPQVVHECANGHYVLLEIVLSQFKGADKGTEEYRILREYLTDIYDDLTIKELEGMHGLYQ